MKLYCHDTDKNIKVFEVEDNALDIRDQDQIKRLIEKDCGVASKSAILTVVKTQEIIKSV